MTLITFTLAVDRVHVVQGKEMGRKREVEHFVNYEFKFNKSNDKFLLFLYLFIYQKIVIHFLVMTRVDNNYPQQQLNRISSALELSIGK